MRREQVEEVIRRRGMVLIQVGGLTLVARPVEMMYWVGMVKCTVDTEGVPALRPLQGQLEYNVLVANVMPFMPGPLPVYTRGPYPGRRPRMMRI